MKNDISSSLATDETVRDVCAEMDERDYECGNGWLEHYSTRVLSAHEREMAEKDAAHKQWRKNYRAKLAEKNAEIARLRVMRREMSIFNNSVKMYVQYELPLTSEEELSTLYKEAMSRVSGNGRYNWILRRLAYVCAELAAHNREAKAVGESEAK